MIIKRAFFAFFLAIANPAFAQDKSIEICLEVWNYGSGATAMLEKQKAYFTAICGCQLQSALRDAIVSQSEVDDMKKNWNGFKKTKLLSDDFGAQITASKIFNAGLQPSIYNHCANDEKIKNTWIK